MRPRLWQVLAVAGLLVCGAAVALRNSRPLHFSVHPFRQPAQGQWSTEDRLRQYDGIVRARLEPDFRRAGVPYPPAALVLVVLKQEETLEVHAADKPGGPFRFVRAYPVLAASGHAGPKLREGDRQVPEGLYGIANLNPNSSYHLALRVDYPNVFDRQQAEAEGRVNLGGDIMIHGNAVSIGCVAMGDPASEDLFVLAAHAGPQNVRVIMSPLDLRTHELPALPAGSPAWLGPLYATIKTELAKYPAQPPPQAASSPR